MSSTKSTFVPDFNLKTPVTTKGNRHPLDNTKEISMKQWLYSRLIELGVINLDPCCTGYIAPPSWGVTTGITALAGGGQTGAQQGPEHQRRRIPRQQLSHLPP